MRKFLLIVLTVIVANTIGYSQSEYTTGVVFPANYQIGSYIEFLKVAPLSAGASGNYEISIAYTRGGVAAAATHLASISHSDPALWREVGRINSNVYVSAGNYNFTVDCNTQYGNARFRIRAVNTLGVTTDPIAVEIKIRAINGNSSWTALNTTGSDLTVNKFLPMTNDWNLYVGNPFTTDGANLAIKAIENGNVGIGTATPSAKLSVNGNILAKEIKVKSSNLPDWPDFVFAKDFKTTCLQDLEKYIHTNKHLPNIPSAAEVTKDGINLGEMNAKLLQKIEELTLHLIEMNKKLDAQQAEIVVLKQAK